MRATLASKRTSSDRPSAIRASAGHGGRLRILALVNSGPADGVRVASLFKELAVRHDFRALHRPVGRRHGAVGRFTRAAIAFAPHLVYVENLGYPCVVAAMAAKATRRSKIIVSTGDAVYAFARSHFHPLKAAALGLLEQAAYRTADAIAVRGSRQHLDMLEQAGYTRVRSIPEGVDTSLFRPTDVQNLRRRLGLERVLTIGVVGSINWNTKRQFCYGRDVLEVVRLLKDRAVAGLVVGGGDGVAVLEGLARDYGIGDRVILTGWIEHLELPSYINLMDVCLSTQSNDLVGQTRITAKLPEYLACGRYVIASDVGGASEFVQQAGCLVESEGLAEPRYLQRVAEHVERLLDDPGLLATGRHGVEVARSHFDYSVLRPRFAKLIDEVLESHLE